MNEIIINTKSKNYKIYIKKDFHDLSNVLEIENIVRKKICIVTDTNVKKLYLEKVKQALSKFGHISEFVFEAGEKSKTLQTIYNMYECFLANKLDRASLVVALGGGVVGDMAGFAASTYMRGISFIQLPTTLLSQVDSSVGGKTGVDFMGNKNVVGTFTQPELVYINYSTLKTLPEGQFASGIAEVLKHGLINSEKYYRFLSDNKEKILELNDNVISEVIYGSCVIKGRIVERDEKESGIREILNFGHTFGHAFEALSDFDIMHGEGVALGMSAAAYLSNSMGKISDFELEEIVGLIKYFGLPVKAFGLDKNDIVKQMKLDKKAINGTIRLILLEKIGEASIYNAKDKEALYDALGYILERGNSR